MESWPRSGDTKTRSANFLLKAKTSLRQSWYHKPRLATEATTHITMQLSPQNGKLKDAETNRFYNLQTRTKMIQSVPTIRPGNQVQQALNSCLLDFLNAIIAYCLVFSSPAYPSFYHDCAQTQLGDSSVARWQS